MPAAGSGLKLSKLPNLVGASERGDETSVDVVKAKPAQLAVGTHHERGKPMPSRAPAKGTTPPPNVIPFGKPRAINAVAHHTPMTAAVKEAQKLSRPETAQQFAQPEPTGVMARQLPPVPQAHARPQPQPQPQPQPHQQPQPAPKPAQQFAAQVEPVWPEATVAPAPPKYDPHKWAVYDKLGLGAPKLNTQKLGKLIVTAYRLLGFAILSIIVVVLVGYISTTLFFYMSSSWVVPVAVSASDEKVVALQAQLAEQQNARDRIADELNQADRTIAAQQNFQVAFAKAIKSDLENRKNALGKIRALASTAKHTRTAIASSNSAYASASQQRMAEEYKAGLIDRNSMLSGKFQLAQITSSNLSLAERQAEYENRAAELEQQAASLDAILANAETDTSLSYEVLQIRQQYQASRLELAKSIETRNSLKLSLDRQDKLLGSQKQAAYLRAITDKANVAFVPYGNLPKVSKGAALYACRASMVICRQVGSVLEVLPGEVQFKHPHKDKMMRGQMVEMKMDDDEAGAAEDDVLFVGGKPLLF